MGTEDKVAVVTGAGTGIGKAVALAFLQDGYRVALAGRRKEPLEQTAREAGAGAGRAIVVPTDVGKAPGCARSSRAPRRRSGGSTCSSTTPAPARRPCRSRT